MKLSRAVSATAKAPQASFAALRDRSGNAVIELAFAAPALFLCILGPIEIGRAMWTQNALDYSVAEAARCASNNPSACGSASQIASYAAGLAGAGFVASIFTANTAASCGKQVTASYPMTLYIPYMNLSVTLSSDACYPS